MTRRILASLLLTLAAPALFASIAELATFDDKVDHASAIVLGRCTRSEAKWDNDHLLIVTYSTFQVEKILKGVATVNELTIITPGGSVGGIHQDTEGVPTFRTGDEKVLFLRNTRRGTTVLYFDQGTYDVSIGEHGERLIAPMPSPTVKIDPQRGVAVNASEPVRSLQQFESDVHTTMREIAARRVKMESIEAQRRQQASLSSSAKRNRWLIAIAALGLTLATIQWFRRT
jgi:hypothetical protein